MALEIDDAVHMSLDDYIAKSSNAGSIGSNGGSGSNKMSTFKERRRRRYGADEDEEDEECDDLNIDDKVEEVLRSDVEGGSANNSYGIWKGPSADTSYLDLDYMEEDSALHLSKEELQIQERSRCNNHAGAETNNARAGSFDLREKINNNMPHRNSQQWRLMRPNNVAQRPAGMPPLVPKDTPPQSIQRQWRNQKRNRVRWRNGGVGPRGGYFGGRGGGGDNRWNELNHLACFNNGRIQFNNQRSNRDFLNKSLHDFDVPTGSPPLNMTITSSGHLSSTPMCPTASGVMPGSSQLKTQEAIDVDALNSANGNVNLRTLLGIKDNFTREEMPLLASKFLDILKNGTQATIHKPIYDMKIQKDLHTIQNKPLMYKCPGGEVVSSDGAGINCQIMPRSSGVSMNYRFA